MLREQKRRVVSWFERRLLTSQTTSGRNLETKVVATTMLNRLENNTIKHEIYILWNQS